MLRLLPLLLASAQPQPAAPDQRPPFAYRAFSGYTTCTLTAPVRRCAGCTLLNQSFECRRLPNIAAMPRTTFLNGSAAACDVRSVGPGCATQGAGGQGTATAWDGEAPNGTRDQPQGMHSVFLDGYRKPGVG